jgi:RND family efflux transporter MFP subunit
VPARFPALFALAAAVTLAGCSRSDSPNPAQTAPPVEAVAMRTGSLPLVERLSGTVWAENQVALYSEVSGRIAEVLVDNGRTVAAGDPLVKLADRTVTEQVRQAEAGLRIAEARLWQAQAAQAEVAAQEKRMRSLSDRNLVTEVEQETLTAQLAAADADVALAEAGVEQAAATLAERQDTLAKTIIRAPIAGVVGSRDAEVGMQVTASTRLFTLGNLDRAVVRLNLTDVMLGHIETGMTVRVYTDGDRGLQPPLTGTLARISPFLNQISRSTEAEIELDNSARRLQPGMFVPVDILYGQSRQATLVPASALFTDPSTGREGVYLLTAAPGEVPAGELSAPIPTAFTPVSIIARGATEVAVADLNAGDWVVTLGQNLLATGRSQARVRPVDWDHVLELQNLQREALLAEIIRPSSETPAR